VRPDQYYTDVIARPMGGIGRKPPAGREVEVVAEEEQQFLARQQQLLAQGLPPQQAGAMPTGVQKTPDRKVVGSPGVQGSPKKMEQSAGKPGAGATTSEGVLANFFNSLLSKKTGGVAGAVQVWHELQHTSPVLQKTHHPLSAPGPPRQPRPLPPGPGAAPGTGGPAGRL